MKSTSAREPGLRLIIAYKLVRAALALCAAAVLLAFIGSGHGEQLRDWADALRHHLASHSASVLAQHLVDALTPVHVRLAALALTLDGLLVLLEGWALWRGYRWGAWIVVLSTAALLPIEVIGLWHHRRAGRLLLLLANSAVAVYLIRRMRRS